MHLSTNDIEYVHLTSIFPLLVPTVLGREHSHGIWVESLRSFPEYHRLGVGKWSWATRLYEAPWVGEWEVKKDVTATSQGSRPSPHALLPPYPSVMEDEYKPLKPLI